MVKSAPPSNASCTGTGTGDGAVASSATISSSFWNISSPTNNRSTSGRKSKSFSSRAVPAAPVMSTPSRSSSNRLSLASRTHPSSSSSATPKTGGFASSPDNRSKSSSSRRLRSLFRGGSGRFGAASGGNGGDPAAASSLSPTTPIMKNSKKRVSKAPTATQATSSTAINLPSLRSSTFPVEHKQQNQELHQQKQKYQQQTIKRNSSGTATTTLKMQRQQQKRQKEQEQLQQTQTQSSPSTRNTSTGSTSNRNKSTTPTQTSSSTATTKASLWGSEKPPKQQHQQPRPTAAIPSNTVETGDISTYTGTTASTRMITSTVLEDDEEDDEIDDDTSSNDDNDDNDRANTNATMDAMKDNRVTRPLHEQNEDEDMERQELHQSTSYVSETAPAYIRNNASLPSTAATSRLEELRSKTQQLREDVVKKNMKKLALVSTTNRTKNDNSYHDHNNDYDCLVDQQSPQESSSSKSLEQKNFVHTQHQQEDGNDDKLQANQIIVLQNRLNEMEHELDATRNELQEQRRRSQMHQEQTNYLEESSSTIASSSSYRKQAAGELSSSLTAVAAARHRDVDPNTTTSRTSSEQLEHNIDMFEHELQDLQRKLENAHRTIVFLQEGLDPDDARLTQRNEDHNNSNNHGGASAPMDSVSSSKLNDNNTGLGAASPLQIVVLQQRLVESQSQLMKATEEIATLHRNSQRQSNQYEEKVVNLEQELLEAHRQIDHLRQQKQRQRQIILMANKEKMIKGDFDNITGSVDNDDDDCSVFNGDNSNTRMSEGGLKSIDSSNEHDVILADGLKLNGELPSKKANDDDDDDDARKLAEMSDGLVEFRTKCKSMEYQMRMLEQSCEVSDVWMIPTRIAQLKQSLIAARTERKVIENDLIELMENNNFLLQEMEASRGCDDTVATRERIEALNALVEEYERKYSALEDEVRKTKEGCQVTKLSSLPGIMEQLKNTLAEARLSHEVVQVDLIIAEEKNTLLTKELDDARERIAQYDEAMPIQDKDMDRDLIDAQETIQRLQAEMLSLRLYKTSFDEYTRELEVLKEEIEVYEVRCSRYDEQIVSLQQSCQVSDVTLIPEMMTELRNIISEQSAAASVSSLSHEESMHALTERNKNLVIDLESAQVTSDEYKLLLDRKEKALDEVIREKKGTEQTVQMILESCNLETITDVPKLITDLREQVRNSERQISSLESQKRELELCNVEKSTNEIEQLQTELALSVRNLQTVKQTLQRLQKECNVTNVEDIPTQMDKLKAQAASMEAQIKNESEEKLSRIHELEETVKNLEAGLNDVNEALLHSKGQQMVVEDVLSRLEKQYGISNINELSDYFSEVVEDLMHIGRKVSSINDRYLIDDINEIPQMLEALRTESKESLAQAEMRIASLEKSEEALTLAEAELLDMKQKLEFSQKETIELKSTLERRQIDDDGYSEDLEKQLSEARGKLTRLERQIKELLEHCSVSAVEEIPIKLEVLVKQCSESEEKLEKMKQDLLLFEATNVIVEKQERQILKETLCSGEEDIGSINNDRNGQGTSELIRNIPNDLSVPKVEIQEMEVSLNEHSLIPETLGKDALSPAPDLPLPRSEENEKLSDLETTMAYVIEACGVEDIHVLPTIISGIRSQLKDAQQDLKRAQTRISALERKASSRDPDPSDSMDVSEEAKSRRKSGLDPDAVLKRYPSEDRLVCAPGHSRLEQTEAEVTRLSKLLIEACNRTEEVERQIIHLQIACKVSDIKEIPARMAMYEEDVDTMDEIYNELQTSEEHVADLQQRLNEAQESVRSCEDMIGELTDSLNRTQMKLIQSSEELDTRTMELNESRKESTALRKELEELNVKALALEGVVHDLTAKLHSASLQRENATKVPGRDLEKLLERKESEIRMLQTEVEDHCNELARAKTLIDELEHDRNYFSVKVSELQSAASVREVDEKDERLMSKALECAQLHAERDSLRRQLRLAESRNKTLQEEIDKKSNLLHEMGSRYGSDMTSEKIIEMLQQENDRTLKRATDMSIKLAECQMRLDEMTAKFKKVRRYTKAIAEMRRAESDDQVSVASFDGTPVTQLVRDSIKQLRANVQKHMS